MVKLCQIHPELEMLVFLLKVYIDLETSQHMMGHQNHATSGLTNIT